MTRSFPTHLMNCPIDQYVCSKHRMEKKEPEPFMKDWEELKAKNKAEDVRARRILEEVEETKRRVTEVLLSQTQTQNRIANTLIGVRATIDSIDTTTEKINKFEKEFGDVLSRLAEQATQAFGGLGGDEQSGVKPTVAPIKQVVESIMKYEKFVFLTGAGISASSGVPTFRGEGGQWTRTIESGDKTLYEAKKIFTTSFYDQHPDVVWDWHKQFHELVQRSKPNEAHLLLNKICEFLIDNGKEVCIVTQNLDNLQPLNPKVKLHYIHGNIDYIRCEGPEMHLAPFSLTHKECKECSRPMRPHSLFFDQVYQHHYGGEVLNLKYDVVVSIGTTLETNLARRMVMNAKQCVEINPQPVVSSGNVFVVAKTAEEGLRELYTQLTKLCYS